MTKIKCLFGYHQFTGATKMLNRSDVTVCDCCLIVGYRYDEYEGEFWYNRRHPKDYNWIWISYKRKDAKRVDFHIVKCIKEESK